MTAKKYKNGVEEKLMSLKVIQKDFLDSLSFIDDIDTSNIRDEFIPAPFGRPNVTSNTWKKKRLHNR